MKEGNANDQVSKGQRWKFKYLLLAKMIANRKVGKYIVADCILVLSKRLTISRYGESTYQIERGS